MELSAPLILLAVIGLGKKAKSIYMAAKEKDMDRVKGESLMFLLMVLVIILVVVAIRYI